MTDSCSLGRDGERSGREEDCPWLLEASAFLCASHASSAADLVWLLGGILKIWCCTKRIVSCVSKLLDINEAAVRGI